MRKYVSRENKPTDQVLDVPTYDFNWDEIPMPSRLTQAVQQDLLKNQGAQAQEFVSQDSGRDESETFEIVQHSKRLPTVSELSMVGKTFIDDGERFVVRMIRYHPAQKTMVAWYERMKKQGDQWIGTGSSEFSSIPEVQHWIAQSEQALYGD